MVVFTLAVVCGPFVVFGVRLAEVLAGLTMMGMGCLVILVMV